MKIQILLISAILSIMIGTIGACSAARTATSISTTTIAQSSGIKGSGGGFSCYSCELQARNQSSPDYYAPVFFFNPQNKHVMAWYPQYDKIIDTNVPIWLWG